MRSLGTSRSPRITEWSKSVPRDSFPHLGDPVSGAAGSMGQPLAGILDVLLQGGQTGAAAEAPSGFGRGWEPGLPGGKSQPGACSVLWLWPGHSALHPSLFHPVPKGQFGADSTGFCHPQDLCSDLCGIHIIPQQIPTCTMYVMALSWFILLYFK